MPTSPRSSPPRAYFEALDALETKLFTYLDKRMGDVKDVLDKQSEQLQRLIQTSASRHEVDALGRQVNSLQSTSDVHAQQLRVLEQALQADDSDRRRKPLQTWQLVLGTISVAVAVVMSWVSCAGTLAVLLFDVVNLVLKH